MKLIVAVHLAEGAPAKAAAVPFDAWDAAEATKTYATHIAQIEAKPARGQLDLRELPCVMQLLREHGLEPELIILADAFVHLDAEDAPGLGLHLFHAMAGAVPVIGVSKKKLPGLSGQFEVVREEEAPPLVVTSAGIDIGAAKARLRAMHGRKRVPTLVKLATRMAKGGD